MRAIILLCTLFLGSASTADTIYRKVDANGRVTFSDKTSGSTGEAPVELESATSRSSRNPHDAVFNPIFETSGRELSAGKAFVATVPGCPAPLLITAYHLLGPSGGLNFQLTSAQIKSEISKIRLYSLSNNALAGEAKADSHTPANVSSCCNATNPRASAGDIAAFTAPAKVAKLALPLAILDARKGDMVFILTSLSGNPEATFRHEAIVTGMNDGYLMYDITNPDYAIRATSGAPVINSKGQVIAINLGGGPQQGGKRGYYGMGNPVSAWKTPLSKSCE